jgi:hypothetical protein
MGWCGCSADGYVTVDFADTASAGATIGDSLERVVNRQLQARAKAQHDREQALILLAVVAALILLANSQ